MSTLKNPTMKMPKPMWPWVLGAATAIGGLQFIRKHRINAKRQSAIPPVKSAKTKLDVKRVD